MKSIKLLILLCICSLKIFSQDTLSSGRLVFEQGNRLEKFKNDTIWYNINCYLNNIILYDYIKMEGYTLYNNGDTLIRNKDEFDRSTMYNVKKIKTKFYQSDTLTIAGIKCQKAVVNVTMKNDTISSYHVYYSSRVGGKNCNFSNIFYKIPGLPLSIYRDDIYCKKDDFYIRLIEYKPLNKKDFFIPKFTDSRYYKKLKKNIFN